MNILWDFDGTLFDTYPVFTNVLYEMLEGKVTKLEIMEQIKKSFSHAMEYFELSDCVDQFKELEKKVSPLQKRPFPYVEKVLSYANLNVIMTHKPLHEVMTILDFHSFGFYFQEIVAGDDERFPRKPSPKAYQYLHRKYHIDLVIGDRELDILPAKSLGIKTCLFQNNIEGADAYLHTYKDFFRVTF